ncbi:hypothetical protein [Bacillus sp. Marseille-P3800]|uniref:hypothetical protein n=1 Tax=Bacillus sp. Marseille-P3800 TaxID=2014782 RepID=UPI000C069BB4|nr:hypothetical protein [Bacillus sp. Marseille-P3800]
MSLNKGETKTVVDILKSKITQNQQILNDREERYQDPKYINYTAEKFEKDNTRLTKEITEYEKIISKLQNR